MAELDALPVRIASKIRVAGNGCWIWIAALNTQGYGEVYYRQDTKRTWLAHRLVYFLLTGRLPERLHHRCHTPACVNPDCMLEAGQDEHVKLHIAARKTCSVGHDLTVANTYQRKDGRGRQCRTCKASRQRSLVARQSSLERVLANSRRTERRRAARRATMNLSATTAWPAAGQLDPNPNAKTGGSLTLVGQGAAVTRLSHRPA